MLDRWPDPPLSEACFTKAAGKAGIFRVIVDARPAQRFDDAFVLLACKGEGRQAAAVMKMVLARQPDPAVTEEMVTAALKNRHHPHELLVTPLSHNPTLEVSPGQILLAVDNGTEALKARFTTRPHLRIVFDAFIECCVAAR